MKFLSTVARLHCCLLRSSTVWVLRERWRWQWLSLISSSVFISKVETKSRIETSTALWTLIMCILKDAIRFFFSKEVVFFAWFERKHAQECLRVCIFFKYTSIYLFAYHALFLYVVYATIVIGASVYISWLD